MPTFLKPIAPWLVILFPILTLPLKFFLKRIKKTREILALIVPVITTLFVSSYYSLIVNGEVLTNTVFKMNNILNIYFRVDAASFLFAIVSSTLWIFTIIYSFGYMKEYQNKDRYYSFLILALSVTMGVAFSGNLLTFYMFYELLTLITYPLVIHVQTEEAMDAGKQYLTYSLSGGALILLGIMFVAFLNEGVVLNFIPGGLISKSLLETGRSLEITLLVFLAGFSVKAAVMPLHRWLPAAMVAPTPISALFHAVAVVNSGVFGIIRIVYFVFGPEIVISLWTGKLFLVLILITIVLASIIAFFKDNLKRRLAYSTVSQLGYISLGAFLLNLEGLSGGILHLFNHALIKITLFFCSGVIYIVTHKKKISEMAGIGKKMPWTMGAFAIASLGMVGIPPSVGFNSKWYLMLGSFNQGSLLIMGLLILSAMLNAGYFLPIVVSAFFKEPITDFEEHQGFFEAPVSMLAPTVILAIATIGFGIWYHFPSLVVEVVVQNIF
ncbi:monovalent cation/H+ antiporter subunit D family protein [Acetohalobium arabaticum]|uniref:NADH/Ubiquinone/plastoquinone (Complex I) n=1 Tax=Acetohalobium arabaticum (strain ATCC 49924 / DSM 5501 / Z-7288) TaxID=574087 RepID=D9QQ30_ACEAZ|nr:monovalent cation/H+ antiporter subunit D family protein [Acetohalobium arabaticum]ADL12621.1 NADH/Ubiquinone/plastoquinone (complex I) [Acetohalobium arabaticum DSM 5501]